MAEQLRFLLLGQASLMATLDVFRPFQARSSGFTTRKHLLFFFR